ncbi:hypothetical protein RI054_09g46940 [Pseudoscourfieldia marina]
MSSSRGYVRDAASSSPGGVRDAASSSFRPISMSMFGSGLVPLQDGLGLAVEYDTVGSAAGYGESRGRRSPVVGSSLDAYPYQFQVPLGAEREWSSHLTSMAMARYHDASTVVETPPPPRPTRSGLTHGLSALLGTTAIPTPSPIASRLASPTRYDAARTTFDIGAYEAAAAEARAMASREVSSFSATRKKYETPQGEISPRTPPTANLALEMVPANTAPQVSAAQQFAPDVHAGVGERAHAAAVLNASLETRKLCARQLRVSMDAMQILSLAKAEVEKARAGERLAREAAGSLDRVEAEVLRLLSSAPEQRAAAATNVPAQPANTSVSAGAVVTWGPGREASLLMHIRRLASEAATVAHHQQVAAFAVHSDPSSAGADRAAERERAALRAEADAAREALRAVEARAANVEASLRSELNSYREAALSVASASAVDAGRECRDWQQRCAESSERADRAEARLAYAEGAASQLEALRAENESLKFAMRNVEERANAERARAEVELKRADLATSRMQEAVEFSQERNEYSRGLEDRLGSEQTASGSLRQQIEEMRGERNALAVRVEELRGERDTAMQDSAGMKLKVEALVDDAKCYMSALLSAQDLSRTEADRADLQHERAEKLRAELEMLRREQVASMDRLVESERISSEADATIRLERDMNDQKRVELLALKDELERARVEHANASAVHDTRVAALTEENRELTKKLAERERSLTDAVSESELARRERHASEMRLSQELEEERKARQAAQAEADITGKDLDAAILEESHRSAAKIAQLEKDIAKLQAEYNHQVNLHQEAEALNRQTDDSRAVEMENMQAEVARLSASLLDAQAQADDLRSSSEGSASARAAENAELRKQMQDEIDRLGAELARVTSSKDDELASSRLELEQAQSALTTAREEEARLSASLLDAQAQADDLRSSSEGSASARAAENAELRKQMQDEIDRLGAELARVTSSKHDELESSRLELEQAQSALTTAREEEARLSASLLDAQAQADDLRSSSEESTKARAAENAELRKQMQDEIDRLGAELARVTSSKDDELASSRLELEQAQSALATAKDSAQLAEVTYRSRISELETSSAEHAARVEATHQARVSELETASAEHAAVMENMQAELARLSASLLDAKAQADDLRSSSEGSASARAAENAELRKQMQDEIDRLGAELARVTSSKHDELASSRLELEQAQSALTTARDDAARVEATHQARVSELETASAEHAAVMEKMQAELARLSASLLDAQAQADDLRSSSEGSASARAAENAELRKQMQDEIDRLGAELARVTSSKHDELEQAQEWSAQLEAMLKDAREEASALQQSRLETLESLEQARAQAPAKESNGTTDLENSLAEARLDAEELRKAHAMEIARLNEELEAAKAKGANIGQVSADATRLAQIEAEAEAQISSSKREADELRGRALAAEASAKQAVETQTVMMQQLQDAVDSWEAAKKELSQCRGELEASQMEVAGYKQHLEHVTQNAGKNAANKPGGMARLFGRK